MLEMESKPQGSECARVVDGSQPVLITGQAHTGKRYCARVLHERGPFASGTFALVECSELHSPEALRRLFGRAFVDEYDPTALDAGLVAQTEGGTIVFHQVGELPLAAQRAVLGLIRDTARVGAIVCTTRVSLEQLCFGGKFDEELLAVLLSGLTIGIPTLRSRSKEIGPLATAIARQVRPGERIRISPRAVDKMRRYSWPDNVAELRHVIEEALRVSDRSVIMASHLPKRTPNRAESLRSQLNEVERDKISSALASNRNNQTLTARLLGLSRRTLIYKMEKYGLKQRPDGARRARSARISEPPPPA